MFNFFQAKNYFRYWLNAVGEHSLQGPFIYELYQQVFKNNKPIESLQYIEEVRHRLENSKHTVTVKDWGAGSTISNDNTKNISDIAKYGVTKAKYGRVLYRLINFTGSKHIIELGTSLGIGSLYLSDNPEVQLTTFEGEEKLLNIAESVFEAKEKTNIKTIIGNIDNTLPEYLLNTKTLDLAYFDANHTKSATLKYFELCLEKAHDKSCFVLDDIHWSKEMNEAWKIIKDHYRATLTIDLFQMGIVFFNPEITRQHFVVEY